jgi:hydroxymethylbilane synthase
VAEALARAWPGLRAELVPIRTSGDRLAQARLAVEGGKGLFVKEIEEALLARRIELAVHSLKDLPADLPGGLGLAAFPEREDPRDVLVSRDAGGLDGLRPGARVGSSSLRRRVQLLARRPDLVLAAAGLRRLGLSPAGAVTLALDEMLPAVGQGTLAVEAREEDEMTRRLVGVLDHPDTRAATVAERSFLQAIGGSCTTPLAAYARYEGRTLWLSAFLATGDGARVLRESRPGATTPDALGRDVAGWMLERGAAEIVRQGQVA